MVDLAARGMAKESAKNRGNLYNFQAIQNFKAKLAKAKALGQVCNVNFVGDSLTVGQDAGAGVDKGLDASKFPTHGTLARLQSLINNDVRYGDAGTGFVPAYHPEGAPLVTYVGTWTDIAFAGVTNKGKKTGINNDTCTFTFNGTGLGIAFVKGVGAGDINITIDGVDKGTISGYNATQIDAAVHEVTGLTNGAHTAVIKNVHNGARTQLFFLGFYPIKSGGALRINTMARSSMRAQDHSSASAMACAISALPPALTVIALQANDYGNQTALATYKGHLQTIITKAKEYGDVILETCVYNVSHPIPLASYRQVLMDLAKENNIALYDFAADLGGSWTTANALQCVTSPVHYNDVGCQYRADRWYQILTS